MRQRPLQDKKGRGYSTKAHRTGEGGQSISAHNHSYFYMYMKMLEAVNNGCVANLYTWPSVVKKAVGAFKVDWMM